MWDFFTRKDDNGKVQRVYYLENCDDLFCKTLPTFNTFVYGAAWRDRDNCVYRLKKTKGYYLLDKFAYFLSYRLIEFNIIKEDEEKNTAEVIGKVSFPKRQCIDFRINDDRFYVG
ncbi:MAG: hypothetical protein LIO44_04140 [Eubacterium sp.]|nr:hypothetical protein [Eubacterium sp.]